MSSRKYILQPYVGMKTRYTCPQCGKPRVFARYVNTETGEYLSDDVGRCNREDKCGYHYTPRQYFEDTKKYDTVSVSPVSTPQNSVSSWKQRGNAISQYHKGLEAPFPSFPALRERKRETLEAGDSFIDASILNQSLTGYDKNAFIQYLIRLFASDAVKELIDRYRIGTSKHWPGATVFWQIDALERVRAGKIMLYGEDGHRVKEPFNHITWVHKVMDMEGYCLSQGLFGEHLLKGNNLAVAITESEKAAVIGSIYLPDLLWLSCGQKNGLTVEKCRVLAGRTVILYPDLGAFDLWSRKAEELEAQLPGTRIVVSDLLEKKATPKEREKGLDIADYLVGFDLSEFREPAKSQWYVDMQGLLRQYQAGEIVGNRFLDLQDENRKRSGLDEREYVRTVKYFESLN